jgi:hypothetical protein
MQQEFRMKIKTMMLTAALALSAGIGAGFSGNSHAIDPGCRGDCGEDRQSCNAGCNSQGCYVACYNAYQACIAVCRAGGD